jgi:hypothetical protein
MSSHFQSRMIALLLEDARQLVAQTSGQRAELDALVTAAEDDVDRAEAVAVDATTGDVYQVRRLLRLHLNRTAASVANARHLRLNAEEQHVIARRLLATLDGNAAEAPEPQATAADSRRKRPAARKTPLRRVR